MLPDWRTPSAEDKRRFTQFVIEQLDAADQAGLVSGLKRIAEADPAEMLPEDRVAFIRAIVDSGASASVLERISRLFGIDIAEVSDQIDRMQAIGFEVKAPNRKTGPKSERSPAFQNAADDVHRIRAMFQRHWNKRNRHESPTAEQIAAERWSLSPEEANALIDRFQRKGSVSQD